MNVNIDKILLEWSYRVERGYPRITKEEDLQVLNNIVTEWYNEKIARTLLENIEGSISEVSLGLNNSSLRHENEHKKYTKRLIKKLKSGGSLVLEREVQYTEESEEDSNVITVPEGAEVKVDVNDDLIGKLVAGLRGVLKHGPDFPEESEKAQKALKKAEKIFTKGDGSYRRIIPVKYKNSKVLIKLSDVSKSTVTDEDEGQDTDFTPSEEGGSEKEQPEQNQPKKDSKENSEEEKEVSENENAKEESELPSGVVEYFGDSYSDGPENPDVMKEDEDDPSKYVDRRDDGKDDKYPDRGYKEFDPKSDEEEEESDEDYRHDKGNEENPPEDEEAAEQNAEETTEELNRVTEKREVYRFNIKV